MDGSDGATPIGPLALDAEGNVYGVNLSNVIFEIRRDLKDRGRVRLRTTFRLGAIILPGREVPYSRDFHSDSQQLALVVTAGGLLADSATNPGPTVVP